MVKGVLMIHLALSGIFLVARSADLCHSGILDTTGGYMSTERVGITVRLDPDTVAFLDRLAKVQDRDRSYLIKQAVGEFVRLRRWQIEETEKAVREADAGMFATDEEVEQKFSKWTA
jgi:predicted transcriptional regulator